MGREHIDTRLLSDLTEQSQDLHSDASHITRGALREFGEQRRQARSRGWGRRRGTAAAAAVGGAGVLGSGRAMAAGSDDVMALQTAASIENLAVSVYQTAATLPFIKGGNEVVAAFIAKTTAQHQAHAQAFNAAAVQAGGQAQHAPDPKYKAVVDQALPSVQGPADVVKLAITLEDVAAQTYVKNTTLVGDPNLRKLFSSVAPVEAQHRSVLLAVQALLAANAADLIALPPDPAKLPAAAGSVGFPDAFHPTAMASPITEGAVK